MSQAESALPDDDVLDCVECSSGPDPQWSVLWLHGLGADGHDFAPIVPELVRPGWPALRFLFPHAPVRPVTLNGGAAMRAWYDLREMDLARRADVEGVRASVTQVEALIARESERGVPPRRIILGGFSQGGAITLAAGAARAEPLAGLVALSTYLPLAEATLDRVGAAARRQPVFMAHGLLDPVVPYTAGKRARDALRQAGFQVDWHAWPMAHQVNAEEIAALSAWIGRRIGADG